MLDDARQQLLQGIDVVIGVVETHGRMETEVMTHGLERPSMREIPYRDRALQEFDLDGAISRKPEIILDRRTGVPAMPLARATRNAGKMSKNRWPLASMFIQRSTSSIWKR